MLHLLLDSAVFTISSPANKKTAVRNPLFQPNL